MVTRQCVLNNTSLLIKTFFLITILFMASICQADSFYSSIGLGMPRYFVSGKAAGMGGAGIAVFDEMAINRANPAALKNYGLTRVSMEFDLESVDAKHELGKVNSKFGNANGFHFLVPLHRKLSFGIGISLIADSRYSALITGGDDDYFYNRKVDASGGLGRGTVSFSYNPIELLHIGFSAQFNFGKFKEDWETDFVSSQYIDAVDEFSTHMRGVNMRFGMIITPIKDLHLGLVYANKATLNSQTTLRQGSGVEKEWLEQTVILPSVLSAGASYFLNEKFLFAVDYVSQKWSEYESGSDFGDSYRIAAGLEFTPSREITASYLNKISYRIGAYYTRLHIFGTTGEPMTENFATCGIGFPFHGNRGRIDLSLQVGQRGSLAENPYEEKIVRIVAALSGGERWFVRRKR